MSTSEGGQTVESVLERSDSSIASFEEQGNSLLRKIQNYLHSNPAALPLIVLVISGVQLRFFERVTTE